MMTTMTAGGAGTDGGVGELMMIDDNALTFLDLISFFCSFFCHLSRHDDGYGYGHTFPFSRDSGSYRTRWTAIYFYIGDTWVSLSVDIKRLAVS